VTLFSQTDSIDENVPLAERMRPRTLSDVDGQEHLLGKGRALRQIIENGIPVSLILKGPPGTGKTTLARLVAKHMNASFIEYSAVLSGVKQIRDVVEFAKRNRVCSGKYTVLFIDEIHRFNKMQQDAFLPHVEKGTITLVGATTENPSFEIIPALLSRCKVFTLKALSKKSIDNVIHKALTDSNLGLANQTAGLADDALEMISGYSGGDARVALNTLELAARLSSRKSEKNGLILRKHVEEALQTKAAVYDKGGDQHFNLISAFHKSIRGSDPDAALYWFCRMIHGGEDPLYISRRMIRIASEDVGLADPQALQIALSAHEAYRITGSPEGELALVQALLYLAVSPKSNACEGAYKASSDKAFRTGDYPVPMHLRNAPTALMKAEGFGSGYVYDHDVEDSFSGQTFFPEEMDEEQYYHPKEFGFEREIRKRLKWWSHRRQERRKKVDER
jgi:putative ATPase